MAQGVVKWFNDAKGFGFISQSNGADVFVHHTAIAMPGYRTLQEGQTVSFDITKEKKGLRAVNVRVVSSKAATNSKVTTPPKLPPPSLSSGLLSPTYANRSLSTKSAPNPAPKPTQISPPPIYVDKMTPLMIAAREGNLKQVETLLVSGANPNACEYRGVTALMFAVRGDHLSVVKALLKAGANPNIEARNGDTPLTKAHDWNRKSCIALLSHVAWRHKKVRFTSVDSRNPNVSREESINSNALNDFCEERWESSKGLAYMQRDNGQFGSFPLHDDYSDEGRANDSSDNEWYER